MNGNNENLIQALMLQILWRTDTVYWNLNQESWGEGNSRCSCAEWHPMPAMQIGAIRVTEEVSEEAMSRWATYWFDGIGVTTETAGKRRYRYGACDPVLTEAQWVDWFNRVMAELDRINDEALKRPLKPRGVFANAHQ